MAEKSVAATEAAKNARNKLAAMLAGGSASKTNLWKKIGRPKFVVAPMVNQSELAYRMLTRRYGAQLCVTPMIHSRRFATEPKYREQAWQTCAGDRPLLVQFCGNDEKVLYEAAKHVEDKCDAVDLNLGCPQHIARRGRYGAFLLKETELLKRIVSHLSSRLRVPVTCKIRLLPTREASLKLAKMLVDAGCSLLTIHGRTKEEKKQKTGDCDWETIRLIREAVNVPVIANGGIGCAADVERCLATTKCEGVMSSEAVLENPALFSGDTAFSGLTPLQRQLRLAREYLDLADKYPPRSLKIVKKHVIQFLFGPFMTNKDHIETLFRGQTTADVRATITGLEKACGDPSDAALSLRLAGAPGKAGVWYMRHRGTKQRFATASATSVSTDPKAEKAEREKRKRVKAQRKADKRAAKKRRKEVVRLGLKGMDQQSTAGSTYDSTATTEASAPDNDGWGCILS